MKIIVADKISERGLTLLREKGWNVVTPAAPALATELAESDPFPFSFNARIGLQEWRAGRLRFG